VTGVDAAQRNIQAASHHARVMRLLGGGDSTGGHLRYLHTAIGIIYLYIYIHTYIHIQYSV
jgi:hypothetical protein